MAVVVARFDLELHSSAARRFVEHGSVCGPQPSRGIEIDRRRDSKPGKLPSGLKTHEIDIFAAAANGIWLVSIHRAEVLAYQPDGHDASGG